MKFSVQSGARYDLKEEEVRDVFSQYGELRKVDLYPKTLKGFDGFLGGKFCTLVIYIILAPLFRVQFCRG